MPFSKNPNPCPFTFFFLIMLDVMVTYVKPHSFFHHIKKLWLHVWNFNGFKGLYVLRFGGRKGVIRKWVAYFTSSKVVGTPSTDEKACQQLMLYVPQMQGPWGTLEAGSIFSDCADHLAQLLSNGPPTGITAIKLFFKDAGRNYISALRVMFDLNGRSFETETRGKDFNNGASCYVSVLLELQVSESIYTRPAYGHGSDTALG